MCRSDAYIVVSCDKCKDEEADETVELCSLAGGGWDERDVDAVLRRRRWTKKGGGDICPECTAEAETGKP